MDFLTQKDILLWVIYSKWLSLFVVVVFAKWGDVTDQILALLSISPPNPFAYLCQSLVSAIQKELCWALLNFMQIKESVLYITAFNWKFLLMSVA